MSPWPTIELGKVAEIAAGGSAPQDSDDFSNVGTPFVRAGSLKPLTEGAIESSLELLKEEVAKKHRLRLFPAGSVLFAKSGMSATKGLVYRLTLPAYVVNHLAAVISGPNLDSGYLRHCLKVFSPTCLIQDEAYPSIRLSDIASMKIPLPPLEKQKRIAAILDRAEALRAKRRAALAQLDELVQSIFIDMFGDPVTNTKGWSRIKLEELIVIGPQNGLYKPASDYGSGVPILRIDAFYDGQVTKLSTLKRLRISDEELNLYKLSPGDIVINRVNSMEYLGKSAIIPYLDEPVVFESNMMRFSVDQNKIEPQYLVQFLQTNFIKGQIMNSAKHAVNQSSINQKDVKSFQVNVPPLPLQKEFIRRVEAINKLKSTHKASLAELDELFSSLQYRAFRGELSETPEINEQSSEGVKI